MCSSANLYFNNPQSLLRRNPTTGVNKVVRKVTLDLIVHTLLIVSETEMVLITAEV
jgi:hypothetical protein